MNEPVQTVAVMLVLTVLGVIWPMRQLWAFPVAVLAAMAWAR